MLSRLLLSFLFVGTSTVSAQSVSSQDLAEPALRSPLVAVEFTGQRCRYCPNMARALKANQRKYGKENYIITALHSLSAYSLLPANHVSLYHPEAKEYAESIKVHNGLPQLVYNTLGPTVSDLVVDEQYKQDDLLACTGNVFYTNDHKYVIEVQTRLRSNMLDVVKHKKIDILFWALENDIVALQDDNGKFTFPAHEHIFRGSVNTTWGEPYEIGTTYTATWDIPEKVIAVANTELVVFFLDHETRTILDAGQFKVKPHTFTGVDIIPTLVQPQASRSYDLSGRPLNRPLKGSVFIKDGKKIISK